jgi:hypothetical protein
MQKQIKAHAIRVCPDCFPIQLDEAPVRLVLRACTIQQQVQSHARIVPLGLTCQTKALPHAWLAYLDNGNPSLVRRCVWIAMQEDTTKRLVISIRNAKIVHPGGHKKAWVLLRAHHASPVNLINKQAESRVTFVRPILFHL